MNKIDTDKLALFHERLTKITNDCEENWYLVKRILYEMDIDEYFNNPNVMQELQEALVKLEMMMDLLGSLKQITSHLVQDYEEILIRHQKTLVQMGEYASSLNAATQSLFAKSKAWHIPVNYTNVAPISQSLQKSFGKLEVIQDE